MAGLYFWLGCTTTISALVVVLIVLTVISVDKK